MARQSTLSFLAAAILFACATPGPSHAASDATCGNGRLNQGEGCDDGNVSAGDGCAGNCLTELGWRCTRTSPSVCTNQDVCGNGAVEAGESCDDGNLTLGDGCQPDCTVQAGYSCTGEPSVCLPPGNLPAGECGDGVVDDGEDCDDGDDVTGDGCDDECQIETGFACTGEPSVCTETDCGNGTVDIGEDCDGGPCCVECSFATSAQTCRAAAGGCDAAEFCSGSSADCPVDTSSGCVTVCRDARFWATRATIGEDSTSAIDLVLDETGPIEVCGQTIDNAGDLGELDSALEGLCVKPQGEEQRELYRALLATTLNCLLSEGECDDILSAFTGISYSECDALCRGDSVPEGPTLDECIDQLECFNRGGQVIDGDCATGTCESDPEQLCGGDFGSCPGSDGDDNDDAEEDVEECVPFDDNCADARLCQNSGAEVRLCGHRLAPRNQKVCREARHNTCTIDDCD